MGTNRKSKFISGILEPTFRKKKPKVEEPVIAGPVSKRTYDLKDYSKEELAKIVADYTKVNPFKLSGLDPRYEYRFINRREDRLGRRVMMGWEIVTGPEAEHIASETGTKTRQGQIIVADGVLAKMPKQIVMAVRQRYQELSRRMIGESTKALKRDVGKEYSRNVEESLKVRDRGMKEITVIDG